MLDCPLFKIFFLTLQVTNTFYQGQKFTLILLYLKVLFWTFRRINFPLIRAHQAVEEDGMWKLEEGGGLTADSSKNHKNWTSGAARSGRFITKFVSLQNTLKLLHFKRHFLVLVLIFIYDLRPRSSLKPEIWS